MTSSAKTVCLYCGAHTGNSETITAQAGELATRLADRHFDLVYGGGNNGLMGIVADQFLSMGRRVTGIRPQRLIKDEFAHPGINELIVVQDMHERKRKMIELADIHIALPGGAGTLDEIIEVYTQTKIGFVDKTCALLNTDHYYDELLGFLDKMVRYHFLRPEDRGLLIVEDAPQKLVGRLSTAP